MKNLYKTDHHFRYYVDSYCEHRGIEVEEALNHAMVKDVAKYYREKSTVASESTDRRSCDSR